LGTLKATPALSNTLTLCELLAEELEAHDIEPEVVRLANYKIEPGIETRATKKDDWPRLLKVVLEADVIIFATPIWWGIHSSLLQRVIERMDALNDELLETGVSPFSNKVGGIVITGAEDGAQHIIAQLCNFMIWNGLSIPPAASLSFLGDPGRKKKDIEKTFRKEPYLSMAKTMARNINHLVEILKLHPYPYKKGGISSNIRRGTVGMKL